MRLFAQCGANPYQLSPQLYSRRPGGEERPDFTASHPGLERRSTVLEAAGSTASNAEVTIEALTEDSETLVSVSELVDRAVQDIERGCSTVSLIISRDLRCIR